MSKQPYHNETSQADRLATLENDRRVHKNTLFSNAHPDEGGRFAAPDQPPRHVVGSTQVPRYPALPSGSFWHDDPLPPERSLGTDVNAQEPVGEVFEQSLGEAARFDEGSAPPPSSSDDARSSPSGEASSPAPLTSATSLSWSRRLLASGGATMHRSNASHRRQSAQAHAQWRAAQERSRQAEAEYQRAWDLGGGVTF